MEIGVWRRQVAPTCEEVHLFVAITYTKALQNIHLKIVHSKKKKKIEKKESHNALLDFSLIKQTEKAQAQAWNVKCDDSYVFKHDNG